LATTPNSSKQKGQKSAKSAESGDEDLTFSESLFFKTTRESEGSQTAKKASSSTQPPVRRSRKTESSGNTEYFAFLNESQKRDHEFFEKLAEKEADREMKSQQMMFSMVKEVARSLRESKVHVKLFNMDKYNINSRTTTLFLISFRLY